MLRRTGALTASAAAILLAGCSAENSLAETTWKGGNMFDSNIVFTFSSGGDCRIDTSYMGSGPCTYEVDGQQALITFDGQTYAFTMNSSQMVGNLMGAGVELVKQ